MVEASRQAGAGTTRAASRWWRRWPGWVGYTAGTVEARPRRDRRRLREEAIVGRGRVRGGVIPVMSREGRTFHLSRESGRRTRYRAGDLNNA